MKHFNSLQRSYRFLVAHRLVSFLALTLIVVSSFAGSLYVSRVFPTHASAAGSPTANSEPTGITRGPDGNLWFTEHGGNKIGKITPSGAVTEYPIPTANSTPYNITAGPDSNLWFAELLGNKIGKVTTSGSITECNTLPSSFKGPASITRGPDGNLWFTDYLGAGNTIGVMDTNCNLLHAYTVPNYNPYGITAGPDGNLWFTQFYYNQVAKITLAGTVTAYTLPTANSGPHGITVGSDGNLWFVESYVNQIGKITPGGTITEYPVPTSSSRPNEITLGPDGNLWFTEMYGNQIGKITPGGTITEYPIPTANSQPESITIGPDGNLWFTEQSGNKIGKITPSGTITEYMASQSSAYASAVLGDGPALYYRLGEAVGSTTAVDSSTNKVNGTYTSAATLGVAGALVGDSDTSVTDNGTGAAMTTSVSTGLPLNNAARTVEAWIKTTGGPCFVEWGDYTLDRGNFGLCISGNLLSLDVHLDSLDWTAPYDLNDGKWHYVAITYDGTSATGYVDGVSLGTKTPSSSLATTADSSVPGLVVGSTGTSSPAHTMDEVAVYPTALTAAQVVAHYAAAGYSPVTPSAKVRPIIFIPGIAGSYLENAEGSEVWPQLPFMLACVYQAAKGGSQENCDRAIFKPMELAADGSSPAHNQPWGQVDVANGIDVATGSPRPSYPMDPPYYGVLDAAAKRPFTKHYYDITAEYLQNSGYTMAMTNPQLQQCAATLRCWIPAAVDWRKSAAYNANIILQLIKRVIQYTGTDRVNILAHSQGGLITNALVHMPDSMGKVYRVVTLGTPYLGAPKLLAELLFRQPCQIGDVKIWRIPTPFCLLNQTVEQELIKNYPGTMELVPSPDYYQAAAYSPLVTVSNGKPISYSYNQARSFIQKILASMSRDMTLVDAAAVWHNSVDNWNADPPVDPQVQLVRMIGYDSNDGGSCAQAPCTTEGQVGEYNHGPGGGGTITAIDVTNYASNNKVTLYYDSGDGTVPLNSANLHNPAKGFDLRHGQHDLYFCAVSHQGLAQAQEVWNAAQPFLEGAVYYTQDAIMGNIYWQNGHSGYCPDGTDGTLQGVPLN